MTIPVLGCPSLQESYSSLANQSSPGAKQGEVGRGGSPAREISFISLVAYGLKVSHSALACGVTASETRQGGSQQYRKWNSQRTYMYDPCT